MTSTLFHLSHEDAHIGEKTHVLNYSVSSGNTVTDTINLGRTATLQKKQNRTSGPSSWKMTEEHRVLENMRNWLFCWLIGEIWFRLHGRRDLGITALCMLYMRIFSCLMIHLLFYIHPSTICSWLVWCLNERFLKNNLHALCNMNRAVHQPIHEKNSLVPRTWINWWLREHEITGWTAVISKSRHLFFQKELNM